MKLVPCEATRYGKFTRLAVVNDRFIRGYARYIEVVDGIISAKPLRKSAGDKLLEKLKLTGAVTFEEFSFTAHTWKDYGNVMKRLRWITPESKETWFWCGPADATWKQMNAFFRRRVTHNTNKDAREC
jgi:hypothetical protein